MRITGRLALCAVLLGITACDPAAEPKPAPTSATRVTMPASNYGVAPPKPGQCLDTGNASVVGCAQPHDAEVVNTGKLTGTTMPSETTAATLAVPQCRESLAEYLGGPDMDATNLVAMPLWPNQDQWARGERWLLCTVVELGSDGKPLRRTGSLEGELQGNEVYRYLTCSVSPPRAFRRGPCDGPHLGEAVPGVVNVGRVGGAMPSTDSMNRVAEARCPALVRQYLGGESEEVATTWRLPDADAWARGYTNVVCYAQAARPVRVRLRNLGQGTLPG